jgi:hypothetical protein
MDENGKLNEGSYLLYRRHKGQQLQAQEDLQSIIQACEWASEQESTEAPSAAPSRSKQARAKQRGHFPKKLDAKGNLVALSPTDTEWYRTYVKWPPTTNKHFNKKIQRCFGVPYSKYLELLEEATKSPLFKVWHASSSDCTGQKPSPLELLVLGSLCSPTKNTTPLLSCIHVLGKYLFVLL